jgi:hypothetical protein
MIVMTMTAMVAEVVATTKANGAAEEEQQLALVEALAERAPKRRKTR